MKKQSTLSRVLRYVGKYPFSLIGSLAFAVVSVVATLFIPVLFGDAVKIAFVGGNQRHTRMLADSVDNFYLGSIGAFGKRSGKRRNRAIALDTDFIANRVWVLWRYDVGNFVLDVFVDIRVDV